MPLILEQRFPLGRFHATRWNQNAFEDRYGEWPPSPWRLLRALAARWIQYSRETGDEDVSARDDLLRQLASHVPAFHVPALSWRADPAIRQYHKTGVEWTAKGKKDAAYKKSMTTLVPDHCRAVPANETVYWFWSSLQLPDRLRELLDQLLCRIIYFGRAESLCQLRRVQQAPEEVEPNCRLSATAKDQSPVLVATADLNPSLETLLAATDDSILEGRPIPPGAAWHYARLPTRPAIRLPQSSPRQFRDDLQLIQFAVGGRVYPTVSQWIRVTERFRGTALKELAKLLTAGRCMKFAELPAEDRRQFALLSGKTESGAPLTGHQHAYFVLLPDEFNQPTRLLCLRRTPFQPDEIAVLLAASETTIAWQPQRQDWRLRLVPLPFGTPVPSGLSFDGDASPTWRSVTPFVVPGGRRRFRKSGRLRPAETPERLLEKLLVAQGLPRPKIRSMTTPPVATEWVTIHESKKQRAIRRASRTRAVLPGYRFEIEFPEPVSGPICVGHSCHFGLGLFVPADGASLG